MKLYKVTTEDNKEERWALCDHCVEAIRSRGEKIFARPMDWEDCTEEENETDTVVCDWCEEEYCISDMNICQ